MDKSEILLGKLVQEYLITRQTEGKTPVGIIDPTIYEEKIMSWIRETEPKSGESASVITVMSINPKAMEAVSNFNQALSFGSSALTRIQEEAIATVVSVVNKCRY